MFLLAPAAFAQNDDDDRLTILITASRFAETVDETLAPVTVITREEIEEKQASTVEEVLRSVPGITLTNNGGAGKVTSLFLRGTESNHVLVLIDGVKVGSATAGATPFQHLPLDQIEKIEVVRGPRSSLYGSEAIGGVIQIFTRKGDGPPRPRFSASVGSHNARAMELGVSGGEGRGWYNFGLSGEGTDGFDACDHPVSGGCFSFESDEPDDDGHENRAVSLRGGVTLTDALSIEGNLLNSESETEFDGSYENETETTNRTASVKFNFRADENWKSSFLVSRHRDESQGFVDCGEIIHPEPNPYSNPPCVEHIVNGGSAQSTLTRDEFNTERNQFAWQNDFRVDENKRMIVGADHLNDKVGGTTAYAVDSRDNLGLFASWRTAFAVDDVEFSLREDDNEQFGDKTTGGIGWGRDLGDGNRVTASYGTAFTVPTFNDLYWPSGEFYEGNPDLKPEKSKSFDFGLAHNTNGQRWSVNFFHTRVKDLIADASAPEPSRPYLSRPFNINKAKITGLEFSAATVVEQWNLSAGMTVLSARNDSGANKGEPLPRRPRAKFDLDLRRDFGKHSIGVNLYAQGKSEDTNDAEIKSFATVSLRGASRIAPHWSLEAKINNLLDKEYETASYYPQDERNITVTLRYLP
ncbi:MAG: TonB-dependent receptor domain-containing protein [bacterium]